MFIPSVHATFRRSEKHSFKEILKITKIGVYYRSKQQSNFCFMAQARVFEKVSTKIFGGCMISRIEWLRMLFFAITFFSDINFLLKFYITKRRTKRLKLCEKKIGHHACLGKNNLSLTWSTYPQKKPPWFGLCARSCAR